MTTMQEIFVHLKFSTIEGAVSSEILKVRNFKREISQP